MCSAISHRPRKRVGNSNGRSARTAWSADGEGAASATLGRLESRDEASGYFNYDQRRARLELGWKRGAWHVTLDGEAKRLEYRSNGRRRP